MRSVATGAAFCLYRHMLVDERTPLIGMALVTDQIAAGHLQLPQSPPVRVMAVTALHQPFVHPVVKRFGKIRLGRGMAAIAQLGLVLNQQELSLLGVMGRMAIQTAHIVAGMSRFGEMRLRLIFAVASQTARTRLLPRHILEGEYLGDVAGAGHVSRAGTMAAFATLV